MYMDFSDIKFLKGDSQQKKQIRDWATPKFKHNIIYADEMI